LIGFVGAFGFTRLSTRLMRSPRVPWWPGSVVSEGGVHVHHLFFGIVLMMVAGGLSFAAGETDGPWYAIYAVLFGIGLGLTIDEYALWLHLDDVYWSREGRSPIDATLIALGLIGFVLLAFVPTRIGDDSLAVLASTVALATVHFGWVLIAAAQIPARARPVRHLPPRARGLRRAAARQAALDLGEALLRGAPPGQAGACRAPVPGRPADRSVQGASARRDRWGHGRGVPGAACSGRAADKVNSSRARGEAIAFNEMIPAGPTSSNERQHRQRSTAPCGASVQPPMQGSRLHLTPTSLRRTAPFRESERHSLSSIRGR
jgi:hypothetical protein